MAPPALKNLLPSLRIGRSSGEAGESMACRYLEKQGYLVLERNYRCRSGEVDVVARHGDTTVFIEVKERRSDGHGAGYEAVTFSKRRRLISAARLYASTRGISEKPLRFDVISIDWTEGGGPRIRHEPGAFDASGR